MTEQLEHAVSFSVKSEVGTLRKMIVHRPKAILVATIGS